jgi:lysophospholipase L1-like esterase
MEINDSAKTIVCYGDSNTWGRFPRENRYPRSMRWTHILQNLLGTEYEVISEGLPGRTFASVNPEKPFLTGITHLKSIIETHNPIDLMIVMLGTNDVKLMYNLTPEGIAKHLEETIIFIQKDIKNVLVICPPEIIIPENNDLKAEFIKGPEISKLLPPLYRAVAEKYGCGFINASEYIVSSKIDGFHWDASEHAKFAKVVAETISGVR